MVQTNSIVPYDSIVIAGATATGKTKLSLYIASFLNCEIVCCDSMQIYRGLDIGTAKPTPSEQAIVPHHMIDVADPNEVFTVADYVTKARAVIEDIWRRGKIPVIVGGTGFYIDAIINGQIISTTLNRDIRENLNHDCDTFGLESLYNRLKTIDPVSAEKIGPNDRKRIIRALEIYYVTGKPRSEQSMQHPGEDTFLHPITFNVICDRDQLYSNIDKRVDQMISDGLVDEIKTLLSSGVPSDCDGFYGIGYRQLIPYIMGQKPLDECIEDIKISTHHYAKRQITWFRHHLHHAINIDLTGGLDDHIRKLVRDILK